MIPTDKADPGPAWQRGEVHITVDGITYTASEYADMKFRQEVSARLANMQTVLGEMLIMLDKSATK